MSFSEDDSEPPTITSYSSNFIIKPSIMSPNDPNHKRTQKCKMTVNIDEKVYTHEKDQPHWYYITYSYEYIGNNTGKCGKIAKPYKMPSNPFYKIKNAAEEYSGTIILKNSMTQEMIKYLLMPIEELGEYSGTRCPHYYKKQIILSIANFW